MLPKSLKENSRINLVPTSSPIEKSDMKYFSAMLQKLKKDFPSTHLFDVASRQLDPRYLAASENERLKTLRKAIRSADWLAPIYGGTGCADIVRYLDDDEFYYFRKNRPIVTGFSDTTFLINYLYFKTKLQTFHFSNACGLFLHNNYKQFFDIIQGKTTEYSYKRKAYHWLNPNQGPAVPIEGIAIGGNLTTFRDLLDIGGINPRSWEDYILFIEDIEIDMEDFHRIIVALDEHNIFMHVKAVVVGVMNEKSFDQDWTRLNSFFGLKQEKVDHIFEYLISDVIEERIEDRDPLYILKVDNFGHNIYKDQMIVPIGGKVTLYPDGKIEFKGPFVE